MITSETISSMFQMFELDSFWFSIIGSVKRSNILQVNLSFFNTDEYVCMNMSLLTQYWTSQKDWYSIMYTIVNIFEWKRKSMSFTFITQFTMEPVCTTLKASPVKSVTWLIVTMRTAWVPTILSKRLRTCYNDTIIN